MKHSIATFSGWIGLGVAGAAWGQCTTQWEQIGEFAGSVGSFEESAGVVYAEVRDELYRPTLYQRVGGVWQLAPEPLASQCWRVKAVGDELYALGYFDVDDNLFTPNVGILRKMAGGWEVVESPICSASDIDALEGDLVVAGSDCETLGTVFRLTSTGWVALNSTVFGQMETPPRNAIAAAGSRLAALFPLAPSGRVPAVLSGGAWTPSSFDSLTLDASVAAFGGDLFFARAMPPDGELPLTRLVGTAWERVGPSSIVGSVVDLREIDGSLWIAGDLRNRYPPVTFRSRLATLSGPMFNLVQPQPPEWGDVRTLSSIEGKPAISMNRWQGGATSRIYVLTTTCSCDSVDFNNDGATGDPADIDAFLSVFAEGPCLPAGAACNDVDFNNDGSAFDPCDVESFLLAFAGGACTACGE